MSSSGAAEPIYIPQKYVLHAYSAPKQLNLKQVQSVLTLAETEAYGQDCVIFHLTHNRKVFAFRFGTVVFFNVPPAEHRPFLAQIGITPVQNTRPLVDEDEIAEDDFTLQVDKGPQKVGFNSAVLSDLSIAKLQLIAQVLAQSNALELIEWKVDELLSESDDWTRALKRRGSVKHGRQQLIQFIGEGLRTRHWIIKQLSVMSEPEKTWDTEELYTLYIDLYKTFDIRERSQRIEKALELCSEVSGLLLQINDTRRAELMELIIILLIVIEVVKSFVG